VPKTAPNLERDNNVGYMGATVDVTNRNSSNTPMAIDIGKSVTMSDGSGGWI
jgi:hypothetical protein